MAIVTIVASSAAGSRPSTYSAEALVVVPAGAGPKDPGAAAEAIKLSVTYAVLIPQDDRVLQYIATRLGMSVREVERKLSVVHETDTSLLRLRFRDPRQDIAIAGARTTAQAITSRVPVSPSIAPGSLFTVRTPRRATVSAVETSRVVPIGLILGFCLGAVLLVACERADPRADDVEALEVEAGCPASSLSKASLATLLQRWRSLAGRSPATVALLPATPRLELATIAAVELLANAGKGHDIPISVEGAAFASRHRNPGHSDVAGAWAGDAEGGTDHVGREESTGLVLIPAGAPGSEAAGEGIAVDSDVVVLVASEGTPIADIRSAVVLLHQFGAAPAWALLTPRRVERPGGGLPSWTRITSEALSARRVARRPGVGSSRDGGN